MAAPSSAADVFRQQKYDVFLSFRGEDTRHNFTSHLYAALVRNKICTYIDDRLERGDEIGPALFTAIEQSKLSVIIFSKNYASSSWCLDELVYILRCKQEYEKLVIPVFYNIDPSHVRKQDETYANAFAILEKKFKDNKVRKWRDALKTAANLSGFHSQNIRLESDLVETIVKDILTKLNRNSSYVMKDLVGMESHIQQIESLLCINTQDVCYRTIGIWGMGGVGKTTLADAVFHRNSSKFDACLFLANIRERSEETDGLNRLRNELISKLLKEENLSIGSPSIGSSYIIDRLSRTKVVVVLDDVSDLSQLKTLLGDEVKFGHGSRIIITTRNKRLLKKRVDHVYEMIELSVVEALQLFQSIAFEDASCITDYSDLSRKVVDYAGRNPLALKVLASSFLHCNNQEDWEEKLNELKKYPDPDIQKVLRISYDRLGEEVKGIFLDIACFLKGEDMCDAKKMLVMHGFSASSVGIGVLIDMSLISIINNRIEMHDLLQEMGRAIDRGIEEPGKRKRLWNDEDVYQVLHNNTGTSTIEAIFLDVSKIRELQLSPAAFRNMHNLKLLKFYATQEVHREGKRQRRWRVEEKQLSSFPGLKVVRSFLAWGSLKLLDVYRRVCNCDDKVFNEYCKVYLPGGLESLPEELRYLYWERYPMKSLPSQYSPEKLVELHLPHSQVKQLWNNVQNLGSLKHLNLSDSPHLIEVPDLYGCPNIETIDLSGCTSLVQIPSQFQNLEKLTDLALQWCTNLKKICVQNLGSLKNLYLSYSPHLIEVPDLSGSPNIKRIYLNGCTSLVQVPSLFQNLENLTCLVLNGCTNLKKMCELPCNLEGLNLDRTAIEEISPSIWSDEKVRTLDLETLDLFGCEKLKRLPPLSVGRLCCLRELDLGGCEVLESIPDSLLSLSTLEYIDLSETMIESIPSGIINASGLRVLHLTNCKKLKVIPELPWPLDNLDAGGCTSLKSVARSRNEDRICRVGRLVYCYNYSNCLELDESARRNIMDDAQLSIMQMASSSSNHDRSYQFSAICPGNEIPEWFSYDYQCKGCELNNIQFPKTKTTGTETGPMKNICLNFVVSAVVSHSECALPQDYESYNELIELIELVCDCNFKTNYDGTVVTYRSPYLLGPIHKYEVDHVVTFLKRVALFGCEANSITQASFHLYQKYYLPNRRKHKMRLKVKKCGIRIL